MSRSSSHVAAAQRFAPPLVVLERVDRRGARIRTVNPGAVAYARRGGFGVEEVYPDGMRVARALAPPLGSKEAGEFAEVTGLTLREVYPPAFVGEWGGGRGGARGTRWRWKWAAVGAVVGAALLGPVGLVVGGVIGGTR
jgi:hypothetical protein